MHLIIYILLTLPIIYYFYNTYSKKSRLTTENKKRIEQRAKLIQEYLVINKRIPSFNAFRSEFPDTDMVEWGDIRTFNDKTSFNTIVKALS